MGLGWKDSNELAALLDHSWPERDPLSLGFRDLHRALRALEAFDSSQPADPEALEAIQRRWYALYVERQNGKS